MNKLRTAIFLLIGVISIVLLSFIFSSYTDFRYNSGCSGLSIVYFSLLNILLGIVRVFTSLTTNLPVLFRVQDFLYSLFIAALAAYQIPFMTLDIKSISTLGQILTVICIVCSIYWSIKICIWKWQTKKNPKK